MKKIAIIGGGPGGLTLARLLQMKGADVKVYERDINKNARVQGAIVDLHFESGLKAIEAAGLLDAFKANYMPGADSYRILDKYANLKYEDQETDQLTFGDPYFRPEIDRGALRKILLASLKSDTVVWDSQFLDMTYAGEWTINFVNGTTAKADVVIGADGARSKIRPYVTDIQPFYTGVTLIQGEIDQPAPEISHLVNQANLSALGDNKSISVQPRGDGGLSFYASTKIDPGNQDLHAFLKEQFDDWAPIFHRLFESSPKLTQRPLHCIPLDQTWATHPAVTLLGDAAHIMPPSGEGVNLAMLDALELAEALMTDDLVAYEQTMRARAAEEAENALDMRNWLHAPGALERLIHLVSPKA